MALPSSGIITLQDIQAEFGGPTSPISLQNYYRGGGLVPDSPANAGIPTSGVIGLQDFYGAQASLLEATMTAEFGEGGTRVGYRAWGVGSTWYGSLSPSTINGETVTEVSSAINGTSLIVRIGQTGLSQSFFASVVCELGTFDSDDAVFSSDDGNGNSVWTFASPGGSFDTGSSTVTFL
jgi:hypothetical protein